MPELNRERRHWEDLASADPMWVILTEPGREQRWDADAFFQSGRAEIDRVFVQLAAHGLAPRGDVALDFGCGLGRLTQAMCERFEKVYGIDISEAMIAGARSHNRHGTRAVYHVNTVDHLPVVPTGTVDFIYSRLVLQHVPRATEERYISEFARILAPGGVCVFQVLTRAHSPLVRARHAFRNAFPNAYRFGRDMVIRKARWELNTIPESRVRELLETGGVEVKGAASDGSGGPRFDSRLFFGVKR